MKKVISNKPYEKLVKDVLHEVSSGKQSIEDFVKKKTIQTYWNVGQFIVKHLLKYEKRAKYGTNFFENLARDTEIDQATLQRSSEFFRAYPISAVRRELTWTHYRILLSIEDPKERAAIEKQIIEKGWNTSQLQHHVTTLHQPKLSTTTSDKKSSIKKLPDRRAPLFTHRIIADQTDPGVLKIDLGMKFRHQLSPSIAKKFKAQDIVCLKSLAERPRISKSKLTKKDLYTYVAYLEKVTDGDTLLLRVQLGCANEVRDHFRLQHINAPERATPEGKKVKQFVANLLKDCSVLVVRTYVHDQYDRYLTDVFFMPGETDPHKIAEFGRFLNQELLDAGLAVPFSV